MATALKAYALVRAGRGEEGAALLAGIVREGPESERALAVMAFTYKAAGRAQDATAAYVAAAERSPKEPEILVALFGAYAR